MEKLGETHNQCNLNFHGIEKNVSDYKIWSENRKTLIRDRITTVQNKIESFNALMSHPTIPVRNHAYQIMRSTIQDCILPD